MAGPHEPATTPVGTGAVGPSGPTGRDPKGGPPRLVHLRIIGISDITQEFLMCTPVFPGFS